MNPTGSRQTTPETTPDRYSASLDTRGLSNYRGKQFPASVLPMYVKASGRLAFSWRYLGSFFGEVDAKNDSIAWEYDYETDELLCSVLRDTDPDPAADVTTIRDDGGKRAVVPVRMFDESRLDVSPDEPTKAGDPYDAELFQVVAVADQSLMIRHLGPVQEVLAYDERLRSPVPEAVLGDYSTDEAVDPELVSQYAPENAPVPNVDEVQEFLHLLAQTFVPTTASVGTPAVSTVATSLYVDTERGSVELACYPPEGPDEQPIPPLAGFWSRFYEVSPEIAVSAYAILADYGATLLDSTGDERASGPLTDQHPAKLGEADVIPIPLTPPGHTLADPTVIPSREPDSDSAVSTGRLTREAVREASSQTGVSVQQIDVAVDRISTSVEGADKPPAEALRTAVSYEGDDSPEITRLPESREGAASLLTAATTDQNVATYLRETLDDPSADLVAAVRTAFNAQLQSRSELPDEVADALLFDAVVVVPVTSAE